MRAYKIQTPSENIPMVSTSHLVAPPLPSIHIPEPIHTYNQHYTYIIIIIWHQSQFNAYHNNNTSTNALNLLSSFEVMWRESELNGEFSPTKIRERHCSLFNPSVISGLLNKKKTEQVVLRQMIKQRITKHNRLCTVSASDTDIGLG